MKKVINFTILLLLVVSAAFIGKVEAKSKLNRRSKINAHIETILNAEIGKVLKKEHFYLYVRVSSRDRKKIVPKAKTMSLGKLGDQTLKKKKSRAVYEKLPLKKRLTGVDVVIFVHPVVEKSIVKEIREVIYNEVPFVGRGLINIFQYRMAAYPQYFNSPHFIEDFKYWYKLNESLGNSILKYVSLTLIAFLFVGFAWYLTFRRTRKLEEMILSLSNPQEKNEEVHEEKEVLYLSNQVGDDRIKYFFTDLSNEEKKDAS